jgi:uncharacterized protein (TIGR03086 family)
MPLPPADRYRRIAGAFGARVSQVPDAAWDDPSPCEGWRARDVVGHLAEWIPSFFCEHWGIDRPEIPPAADAPAAAWRALDGWVGRAFDDPAVVDAVRDTPMGPKSFADAFDTIATTDVFLHTWDLARATGLDERLDPDEVRALLAGMEPMDAVLRRSGHYGPRVAVPDDADDQTRLIAFIGRRP